MVTPDDFGSLRTSRRVCWPLVGWKITLAIGITSERISTSSSTPGRPRKNTSTISSKLNSQNGSFRFFGESTCALSSKQWPYSLCGSSRNTRRSPRASRIWRSSTETPLDLPTPVVPNTAKCLRTISSTLTQAGIEASCCTVPMSIVPGPDMSKISRSSRGVMRPTASPIIGYSVTPRWKKGPLSPSLISPSMSSAPVANSPFASSAILVMTPTTSASPARMPRNLPTVARTSLSATARRTCAWLPVTESTRPSGPADCSFIAASTLGP